MASRKKAVKKSKKSKTKSKTVPLTERERSQMGAQRRLAEQERDRLRLLHERDRLRDSLKDCLSTTVRRKKTASSDRAADMATAAILRSMPGVKVHRKKTAGPSRKRAAAVPTLKASDILKNVAARRGKRWVCAGPRRSGCGGSGSRVIYR